MQFFSLAHLDQRKHSDLLVLPFWKKKDGLEQASSFDLKAFSLQGVIGSGDFKAKEGEVLFIYAEKGMEKRIALLGLGEKEKATVEKLRRSSAALVKAALQRKIKHLTLLLPEIAALGEEAVARGIAEGLLLTNYQYLHLKHDSIKEDPPSLIEKTTLIGLGKKGMAQVKKTLTICQAVYLARDLVNGNADDITPQHLAKIAMGMGKQFKQIKATVFDKKRISKEKMGLLLAVNRGCGEANEPVFIILEYKGAPKSRDLTVVVGKGITYDTGGLNLKSSSMDLMKGDMAGAAAALGIIHAAAALELKVNLTVLIPSTENSIGCSSYKPGDVYKSYSGKTVEIGNTDAEGRLILADALAYAVQNLKPSRIIDLATLTGAMEIALGPEASGLMSNNDQLAESLLESAGNTFERAWRFPLFEEYRDFLKSDIADMKNIGGRSAGCITAALFLQEFVGKTPWAHFDIASTAFTSDAKRYNPKYATGVGIRLMIDFLEKL